MKKGLEIVLIETRRANCRWREKSFH